MKSSQFGYQLVVATFDKDLSFVYTYGIEFLKPLKVLKQYKYLFEQKWFRLVIPSIVLILLELDLIRIHYEHLVYKL